MRCKILFSSICLIFLPLAGCQSSADQQAADAILAYSTGDYARAEVLLDPLAKKTNSDFVLNNDRLGSTALVANNIDLAQTAFLRSYEVINSVGVNNGGRSLGAALIDEKIKVWKGEPFERVMVNFYLGLTYYMQHDYNNARAAFENALFKLRDYGNNDDKKDNYNEIDSNFALGYLMLGKCWQRLGDDAKAQQMFDRVAKLRPELIPLVDAEYNRNANVLLVIDWGQGPQIETAFDGSIVGFGPKPYEAGPVPPPHIRIDDSPVDVQDLANPPIDLLALAQDRRWQDIDTIRAVKSALGTGLIAAGAVEGLQNNRSNQELGLALLAGGLLLKATSQADIRQWEMLPRTTFVIPLHLSPGNHDITIHFPGGWSQTWKNIPVPDKNDNTYYFRVTPWNSGVYDWPPKTTPVANNVNP
jgi:tetratricopeptide (TPR) repeat protein